MNERQLYRRLVKLAYSKPEYRAKLLPIIKQAREKKAQEFANENIGVVLSALGAISMFAHKYKGNPVMDVAWKYVGGASKQVAAVARQEKMLGFSRDIMDQAKFYALMQKMSQ